jgi:DNA-binding NtrC family response regulator
MDDPLMVEKMRKEPSKYTILVVDDQELLRNLIDTFLSKLGHSCVTAIDGVDALEKMKESKIDAVVTDIRMPNMDGITLTSKISIQYPGIPIMIMTAFDEGDTAGLAITAGARDFIRKPFSLNEFSVRLHKMINDSEAQKRMRREKGVDQDIQESMNELESLKQMEGEKDVDQDIQESINELEFLKQMEGEKDVDQFIQEFLNELESSKQIKREKDVGDGLREALDELEASLKKIWDPPKNT